MKFLTIILICLTAPGIHAQEILTSIGISSSPENKTSSSKQQSSGEIIDRPSIHYQYFYDTLNLPFRDDFASNNLKKYHFTADYYIFDSAFTNPYFYYKGGNCITPSGTYSFMKDTSWLYTFNVANQRTDSTAKNPTFILLFDSLSDCQQQTDVKTVWETYYRYTAFDSLTGIPLDSFLVQPNDTFALLQIAGYRDTTYLISNDLTALWTDNYAFVNNTYPVNPITIGVATLDGLDGSGEFYNPVSQVYGQADYLTSKPLDLSSFIAADSLYLSFFYEAQGYGDYPNRKDSLIVEFKNKDSVWNVVWSLRGPDTIATDTFTPVMIPVLDTSYFYKGFQFRFRNKATISGNNDHWHIDYVFLKENRRFGSYNIGDIAFTRPASSLLKNYQAMPWKHFVADSANEIADYVNLYVKNCDFVTKPLERYSHSITELTTNSNIGSFQATNSIPLAPFQETAIQDNNILLPAYLLKDSSRAVFRYKYMLQDSSGYPNNDTLIHDQIFDNYFAYDDGTAEKAYGLFGSGMKLAYEFELNEPDTLRAVQFYFVHYNSNVSNREFALKIWSSITEGSTAETLLYTDEDSLRMPLYKDSLNAKVVYKIEPPLPLPPGKFYIGWQQTYEDMLNIGYDMNSSLGASHTFYSDNENYGVWAKSRFIGSLMIRPLVGKPLPYKWEYKIKKPKQADTEENALALYPNPAQNTFNLIAPIPGRKYELQIFNYMGTLVAQQEWSNFPVDVSRLSTGLYLVKIIDQETIKAYSAKLVKF